MRHKPKPSTRVIQKRMLLTVAGLTVLAFVLRVSTIGQSLYGDELLTFEDTRGGFAGVFEGLERHELNPPLYFLLAWVSAQFGEPTIWIRLPSLVFGTVTVPVVYLLGRRTVGGSTGLVGAALVALSPFALFYSVEARAYATLIFLVSLSTLALLYALQTGRRRWWVVYALCAALALYTHYTGVFILCAQAGWAFWTRRERLRELAVAHMAIVAAYLPWIPSFLDQRDLVQGRLAHILVPPVDAHSVATALLNVLPGRPFVPLREAPGRPALTVIAVTVGLALLAAAVRLGRRLLAERPAGLSSEQALLVLLAVATPAGIILYSMAGTDLLLPRNFGASLPAMALVIAWLLVSLGRLAGAVAVTVVFATISLGTLDSLGDEHKRPAAKEAARFVDARAQRGDVLVYGSVAGDLHVYRDRPLKTFLDAEDARGWRYADARGGRVFMVRPYFGFYAYPPKPPRGLERRYTLRLRRVYPGFQPLAVLVYAPSERRGPGTDIL